MKSFIITTPKLDLQGGVSSYVRSLKGKWIDKEIYIIRGSRDSIVPRKLLAIFDLLNFVVKCIWFNRSRVFINTSFNAKAFNRDLYFIRIAKWCNLKCFVFIHGWDKDFEAALNGTKVAKLNKCAKIYVLASPFKNVLEEKGVKIPIVLETTVYEDISYDIVKKYHEGIKFVFLGRLEQTKGAKVLFDAFCILKKKYSNVSLDYIGDGEMLAVLKEEAKNKNIEDVTFYGFKSGVEKMTILGSGDVYVLPTFHGEGLPISILEAMRLGLPIVTRNVGGIPDHIENEKSGFITEFESPEDFAILMEKYIDNPQLLAFQGNYNKKVVQNKFASDIVCSRMEASFIS